MFRRLLIANRGEIAIRIARTARALGIRCIGIYSAADRGAAHLRPMDEAVEIGGPLPAESYLNADAIVREAKRAGAEAIHPGYGFLSENAAFAKRCEEEGLVFVGPPPRAMALSGDKIASRKAMAEAGVPVTKGADAIVGSVDEASEVAADLGYPVLFKATAGGGGIGMSRVDRPDRLAAAFEAARSVALANFGNPDLFLEKYIQRARHVEVQVLMGDRGEGLGFVERECSVQRRHQKLVEETPSPAVTARLRAKLIADAVRGLRHIGYRNAGTVEFLLHDGRYTFNEVNARLQVEHPITEMVTGVDLVEQQLRIAAGDGLGLSPSEISHRGHALECRINAEDPLRNFLPSPGRVVGYREPSALGVRVDSGIAVGSDVPSYYDPLVAKVIAHGRTRPVAIARLRRALDAFVIRGVHTTIPFHRRLLGDRDFLRGRLWTTMVADLKVAERIPGRGPWEERVAAIAAALAIRGPSAVATHPLRSEKPSSWALAGRRELLGGVRAVATRRRW